ncbi:hypothetical protein ACN38_g5007 [Penicillium nordicum]|uniref:Secreted protein n=1 Tax=Penicillium nordicum TaxID=229535 RepID=A0A0M8P5P8_9EURO|nr:hypothetical protein ACN38_g5007 [Penicillium nordicum]
MFLKLIIGACWWETTHEHSCALHFGILCAAGGLMCRRCVCRPAIKLPWLLRVIARLRYLVSFVSHHRNTETPL